MEVFFCNAACCTLLPGFAQANQFNYGPGKENLGNSVQMVSNTRTVPCDVVQQESYSKQITCYTRSMPEDNYVVQVSVDGELISDFNTWFYSRGYQTPVVQTVTPVTGLPGTLITIRAMMFTDVYGGASLNSNGNSAKISRVYIGGMPCDLLYPNSDKRYGISLDYQWSQWGTMTCRITGTYVGHQNVSFIVDGPYGRSLSDMGTYFVSSLNKLAMFQTYAVVTSISPSAGSSEGGAILTIKGQYFDQTDAPARVLVGGQNCPVLSVSESQITCRSPAQPNDNRTVFAGGRGLKLEVWNKTTPQNLEDIMAYNESTQGYSTSWLDLSSYSWTYNSDNFAMRLSGFYVPAVTDDYKFYLTGGNLGALYLSQTGLPKDKSTQGYSTSWLDLSSYSWTYNSDNFAMRLSGFYVPAVTDDYKFYLTGGNLGALYLSQTGLPKDKVQIISSPYWWVYTQASSNIHLEEDKEYYFEILFQKTFNYYSNSLMLQIYQTKNSFTPQQTREAQNEVQVIGTSYSFFSEVQEFCLNNWNTQTPIQEVQEIVVESPCVSSGDCTAMQFSLLYNNEATEPIAVGASSDEVAMALNALPSIQNDTVSVMKTDSTNGFVYTVTFNSNRGDFDVLQYDTDGNDINIEISEITKGSPKFDTFTLMWNGVSSSPLSVTATPDEVVCSILSFDIQEVRKEIYDMAGTKCPRSINGYTEGGSVKYFQDFETDYNSVSDREAFCGHFSALNPGILFDQNQVTSTGQQYGQISLNTHNKVSLWIIREAKKKLLRLLFNNCTLWQYTCIDMLQLLMSSYPGTDYNVQQITLNRLSPNQDYLIDTVYIGSDDTVTNMQDLNLRRSALARRGIFLQDFSVIKKQGTQTSGSCYSVTLIPMNCGYDLPLLGIRFAQVNCNNHCLCDGENEVVYQGSNWNNLTTFTVKRVQAASSPIMGSFGVSIYGQKINNLPVNISAANLKYALERIPGMGQLDISRWGDCRGYWWRVTWLSAPGNQPVLQINSTSVIGKNANLYVYTERDGGLFKQNILGDFFRVPQRKPQVQVYINNIISMCSGNCSYQWDPLKTPVISGISPMTASDTILTVTGSKFTSQSANGKPSVSVGSRACVIVTLSDTQITCSIGNTTSGSAPVTVYVPGVGFAKNTFNFTILPGGSFTFTPSSGSTAGGIVLTISGYGFSENSAVRINNKLCPVLSVNLNRLQCTTPADAAGSYNVTVTMAGVDVTLSAFFTYDTAVTPTITQIHPARTFATERANLTISGSNFQTWDLQSSVSIDNAECSIMKWTDSQIICLLPVLRPGVHNIQVKVKNWGFASASSNVVTTIEYVLQVTSVRPLMGSLYGGTKLTLTGSGFGTNPDDIQVLLGQRGCSVTAMAQDRLECVVQAPGKVYTVTNLGTDQVRGIGYAWAPSSLEVFVGDKVQWQWQAQSFIGGIGYQVFSVSNPGDTTFGGQGFNSGPSRTPSGFFTYEFTVPGVYYYSSGYIDNAQTIAMQGVVTVNPLPDDQENIFISVLEIEANYQPSSSPFPMEVGNCTAEPLDCSLPSFSNSSADAFIFQFSSCVSPTVTAIRPPRGTIHDVLNIEGTGFSSSACANEVTIGGHPCEVINSTFTEINCYVNPEDILPVGFAELVSVTVNNRGNAISTIVNEFDRRFVLLPTVDSISPSVGSTTGNTRVTILGSGFSGSVSITVVGMPCSIVSFSYTSIICDTAPSAERAGNVQLSVNGIPAACYSDCRFHYTDSSLPQVDSVSPDTVDSSSTVLSINGTGFGSDPDNVLILIGDFTFHPSQVTETEITCPIGPLPAGSYILNVVVMSKGLASGNIAISSLATATLSPNSGSFLGGTTLLITGNGFYPGYTTVTVGGIPCAITNITTSEVKCTTAANNQGNAAVNIQVLSTVYPPLYFMYSVDSTPVISSVDPSTGSSGMTISISGSGFGTVADDIVVTIGGAPCAVIEVNDTEVQCTLGSHSGGSFAITLLHVMKGYATSSVSFSYKLDLKSITPSQGSFGGGAILQLSGDGFDEQLSAVFVCNTSCVVDTLRSSSTTLYCEVPLSNGTGSSQVCDVTVSIGNNLVTLSNAFTYKLSLTPVVTAVTPRRGGTGGGTSLTISGSGFGSDIDKVMVTIARTPCNVTYVNETEIICITDAQPQSQRTKVKVNVGGNGIAKLDNADFFYIDVWSSPYTWGGETPPDDGSFAVITPGQTILLDTSTAVLKMLLIQGGTLVFDEVDLELNAENILIVDGGTLQVGTEQAPFQHKAIITLHGHLRSPELPLYGAKTLAVREGTLDLHGTPVPFTWTRLAETAEAGSTIVELQNPVTWKAGDEIVIASTGDRLSQNENELMVIESISSDGTTVNLTNPLMYTHLGVSVRTPDGQHFEARAEVGLLTRNVVIRGSENVEWEDNMPACPDGFDPGEFAVQTCFQGRYGDQVGSDQFGGCIMFSTPLPNQNSAIGRIEYVEVFHAGQAFRLGRYPINWHLMGDLKFTSYVRGCSIHQTYNRAVAMYKTSNLLVERNVIYDIMGGALIFEDGSETGNVLQYNLAVFVMQSTSLLNDDITPAAFWISNPNNTIRHNAVAGGSHIGFWYRLQDSVTGELRDANICEKNEILGQFYNNSVHSQGWYGLWIFEQYYPMQQGYCYWYNPQPAVFDSLTTWNCLKGAEWLNAGALQFKNFLMVNNELAGIEMKRLQTNYVRGWGEAGGAMIINSTVIGHLDELGLLPGNCTQRGIVLPLDDGLTVAGIKFINFDRSSCAAMGLSAVDSSCGYTSCGGWRVKFSGVQYFNTTNKAGFTREHEAALMDTDGSLSGHANNTVIPYSALLDPSHCQLQVPEWSAGYSGSVCDSTVSFHRLNILAYWYLSGPVLLSDSFGTSIVYGMALIPDGQTFNWTFQNFPVLGPTNTLLYGATFSGFKESNFVIIRHQCAQNYEGYNIVDNRNGLSQPLNQSSMNGDWYFDNNTSTVEYIISGNKNPWYWYGSNLDPSEKIMYVYFIIYQCYFTSCYSGGGGGGEVGGGGVVTNTTAPPPRTSGITLWSNTTFWLTSAENNYAVPVDGSSVVIPRGWLVVIDIDIPTLSRLSIYGTLEVPTNMSKYALWATNATLPDNNNRTVIIRTTYLHIQDGTLLVGQPDEPFQGELQIIFRGNMMTPDWLLPEGFYLAAKVLEVLGTLDLHGKPHSIYRTKLAMTADAGSTSISLADAVDWQVGDDILITTTSYDPWQAETRKIVAISEDMKTLILNDSLSYAHIAETYYINETNQQYTLAADVGLLSRNIKIISEDYPGWYQESYGARVLVRSGAARLSNVEFYHTGQNGYISENITSYIQGCSFHQGFSPAIGILGTNKLSVDDNIIYFTVGQGILDLGIGSKIRRNLVALTVWPGSFQGKKTATYTLWHAAIEINQGADTVLQDNIVSGFERSGYRINGEPCPGTFNPAETWSNNEAHGGLYGVYLNGDGLPDCTFIQGFTVWKCWDYGIYFQTYMNVQISNVTLVDNGMGIMPMSYTPPSVSHQYSNRTIQIENSLFVGSSPDFNCSDVLTTSNINIQYTSGQRSPRPLQGGRSAVGWPTFASQHNGAPATPHAGLTSYTAINGLVTIKDSTFAGFRNVCSGQINVMFITNPNNEDLQHPIHVMGIQVINSTENAFAFIHRPDLSLVNPSKCVDLTCDAKRKTLLKDLDGSLLGQSGTVVPQSEYQWAGDTRYGLGDYRIPKVMLTYLNGSRIPINEIAPNKGVIRDSNCTYMPSWQSYKCFTLDYEMLVIESLDSDTETRRLSPVAVLADGYVDLLNGNKLFENYENHQTETEMKATWSL
ncbi:PKHL1 protein, partial [Polypterus senegalus]|nr:PKHL1 protein [Polypterus senegalus]